LIFAGKQMQGSPGGVGGSELVSAFVTIQYKLNGQYQRIERLEVFHFVFYAKIEKIFWKK
jgi:hypothetical protein